LEQPPVGPLLARAHQLVQLVAQLGEGHQDWLGDQPERREQPVPVLEPRKDQQEEQPAEPLVRLVHKPPSNNKWAFFNSRSARSRRSLPCCRLLSRSHPMA
jgi:hypothetical protein